MELWVISTPNLPMIAKYIRVNGAVPTNCGRFAAIYLDSPKMRMALVSLPLRLGTVDDASATPNPIADSAPTVTGYP